MADFGKNATFYKIFAINKEWKFVQVPASSNVVLGEENNGNLFVLAQSYS